MKCTSCSSEVLPIVCVDIDGTLGDYHQQFVDFASAYFDRGLPRGWQGGPGEWESHLGLNKSEYREAKLAYRQGGMKRTMPLRRGAKEMMHALAGMQVEIWLTTTRPWMRLDSVDPDTREWLRRHQIPYDHLLYDEDKYAKLANIVDPDRVVAVLDDLTEQCDLATESFGEGVAHQCLNEHNRWEPFDGSKVDVAEFHLLIPSRVKAWLAR